MSKTMRDFILSVGKVSRGFRLIKPYFLVAFTTFEMLIVFKSAVAVSKISLSLKLNQVRPYSHETF